MLEVGGETLILTHDMLAEGVHFLADQDPADIAWKLVATNLSDLAGKGAEPLGVLLGHTLGNDDARFVAGLAAALTAFNTPLLGGDTIAALGPRTFGLTAARAAALPEGVLVMHPGPINRGVELAGSVADGARSVVLEQVEAGVAVRMAVLESLFAGEGRAA